MKNWLNKATASVALAAGTLLAGCSTPTVTQPPSPPATTTASDCREFSSIARDVKNLVMREAQCRHFAGEQTGAEPRQSEVARVLETLRCDKVRADAAILAKKYPSRSKEGKWVRSVEESSLPETALLCVENGR